MVIASPVRIKKVKKGEQDFAIFGAELKEEKACTISK